MKRSTPVSWQGTVIGHWLLEEGRRGRKAGRPTYRCISKCGVVYPLTSAELVLGGPQTCEACRERKPLHTRNLIGMNFVLGSGKNTPPISRIVDEKQLDQHQSRWLRHNIVNIETRTLKNQATVGEWEKYGKALLVDLIEQTGLGLDHGWKVSVADVVGYGRNLKRPQRNKARVYGERSEVHGADIRIYPADTRCNHAFEVRVHSARTGQWREVLERLRAACSAVSGGKIEADEPGDPPPAQVIAEAVNGGNGKHPAPFSAPAPVEVAARLGSKVGKLEKLQTGLASVIAVAREAEAGAAMRAEIKARVDALRAKANPLAARADELSKLHAQARKLVEDSAKELGEARKRLKVAEEDYEWAVNNEGDVRQQAAVAQTEVLPLMEELNKEVAELDAADKLEAERVKSLGEAPQLAGLLAALEKMGG